MACAPKLNWLEDRIVNIPRHLSIGAMNRMGLVCEWRPFSRIWLQIFESLGLDYRALGGLSLFEPYWNEGEKERKFIFGSARRKGEIDNFRTLLESETYEMEVTITPSEVEEEIW